MENCYSNTHAYGLTLTQTLWSFESFSRLKEANLVAASAQVDLLGAQQALLLRVATAYFGILSAKDQLATNRRAHEAFGTLLNQAKARERTGISPHTDVSQAQSFYDATEQGVIDGQNALDDAELVLTEIIGVRPADIAPLREDIPLTSPDPDSADAWVSSARQDNPAVRAAGLQAEAADRDIGVQRGKGLPNITLNGSDSHSWQDLAFGGRQTLDTVGVSFNWPLFQSGAVSSAVRQSRALYRRAQALYESVQRDSERQTRAAYRGVVTGILRISAARRAVESGRQAVEASQRNVEFGTGSVFDLLNAQNNYYAAQRAYSQTRYDYLTAVLTLKQQAGRIRADDLEVIDGLLVTH
jgi:outer membrane protein